MAVKMNLWSLTLLPGEKYPLYIRRDFTITNAALGEELRSPDGRSVVKVTHHPLPPLDSDSDDELDSDLADEMGDEFELDDEDVEGEETEKRVNGVIGGGKDEVMDEDGDEDDEDEDDEYSDDEEVEETIVLCSLTAGKIEQAMLNLTFVEGEAVMFEISGENAVHLVGNYINQDPYENSSDSEFSGEDDYSEVGDEELDEEDEAELQAVSKGRFTELPEAAAPVPVKKSLPAPQLKSAQKSETKPSVKPESKPAVPAATPKTETKLASAPSQKRKADDVESPVGKPAATPAATAASSAEGLSKSQKKKLAKKAKLETEGGVKEESKPVATGAAKPGASVGTKPQKKTLPSGLVIEDIKVGDGPVAKTGKRLGMRYIGKLESGKQFDANKSGKPFSFALGKGEVIQGWDQGLAGMAVGGERRLTIPAGLAYGNQKVPGVPKNSTLKFDVKLVSVT